jgi:hypothetical protein
MFFRFGPRQRRKRRPFHDGFARWLRWRNFEYVDDDPDEKEETQIKGEENPDVNDEEYESDDYDEDQMSGYLDITMEDLSKTRRVRSQLDPITEEEIHVLHSNLPFSLQSTLSELKSPSAMRLTRTRLRSPQGLHPGTLASKSKAPSPKLSMVKVVKQPPPETQFVRNRTQESFQGSLESMDSLAESYWDPDDDASHMTPAAANLARSSEFFFEHVRFLRVQTQPRQVEVVWSTPPPKF